MSGHSADRGLWLAPRFLDEGVCFSVVRGAKPNNVKRSAVVRMMRFGIPAAGPAGLRRHTALAKGKVQDLRCRVPLGVLGQPGRLLFAPALTHLWTEVALFFSLARKVLIELLRSTLHSRFALALLATRGLPSGDGRVRVEVFQRFRHAASRAHLKIGRAHTARPLSTVVWEVTPRACQLGALRILSSIAGWTSSAWRRLCL
jgi:hypothetical protein